MVNSLIEEKIAIETDTTQIENLKKSAMILRHFKRYSTNPLEKAKALIICSAKPYRSKFFEHCFKHIFALYDQRKTVQFEIEESIKSVSMAAQNILLTCTTLGIGAVPMSAPSYLGSDGIKDLLHIPKEDDIPLLIALGYPNRKITVGHRKPVNEISTWFE
jgi:nitroreductase